MAQRRHHYEVAFESYLRDRRVPYVAVDEAKKALLPDSARLMVHDCAEQRERSLKSFDFVVYGESANLLVEIKGRKLGRASAPMVDAPQRAGRGPRLESWVNGDDVGSLETWSRLFGDGFEPVFVFVYWCQEQPASALFEETFEHRGRWYALRAVFAEDYARAMRVRSRRWGTVHVDRATFEAISHPFSATWDTATPGRVPALLPLGA